MRFTAVARAWVVLELAVGCGGYATTVDASTPATVIPASTFERSNPTALAATDAGRARPTRSVPHVFLRVVPDESGRFAADGATPVITDTGFVVQASEFASLIVVNEPRSTPVGVWIECSHFAVASIDAPVDAVAHPVIPHAGAAYSLSCWYEPDHDPVPGYPVIVLFDPLEPVPGLVDIIDVAEFAQSRLDFDSPAIELSPAVRQVVGVETWLAVTSELEYLDVTAQAGLAWATVRTTFREAVWDLGDGSTLSCTDDAATTWNQTIPTEDQTSVCVHTYIESSADAGYGASATVTWSLEWINNEAPDGFVPWATFSLTTPLVIDVVQLQAVIR